MAIANLGKGIPPNVNTVKRVKTKLDTSIVANNNMTNNNILKTLGGYNWTVDYYQQRLGTSDTPTEYDMSSPISAQQYTIIKDLKLTMDSPMDPSTIGDVSLTFVINLLIPNVGDLFIGKSLDGRMLLFRVSETNAKSYMLSTVYSITATIYSVLDDHPEYYNDLNKRITSEYVYDPSASNYKADPLVEKGKYDIIINLLDIKRNLISYYNNKFYNNYDESMVFKHKTTTYVDYSLQMFYSRLLDADSVEYVYLNNFNIDTYSDLVWSSILKQDKITFRNNKLNIYKTNISDYGRTKHMNIVYKDVKYIMVSDKFTDVDRLKIIKDDFDILSNGGDNQFYLSDDYGLRLYNHDTQNVDNTVRIIDTLLDSYFSNTQMDVDKLIKLTDEIRSSLDICQYYYIPILILLINYTRSEH